MKFNTLPLLLHSAQTLLQYLVYILVCFCGYACAGVLAAITAIDWSDIVGKVEEARDVRDSISAASV